MRKFKLIDEFNNEFDLMRKDAFLSTPNGLGFSSNIDFFQVDDFFIETEKKINQSTITGEMIFLNYEIYQEFFNFINKKTLKLGYKPLNDWYFADCEISKLEKSEIGYQSKRLICNIEIVKKTPFYLPFLEFFEEETFESTKRYNYTYPYFYQSVTSGKIEINSQVDNSPTKIIINAPVLNPSWTLEQNGKVLSRGKINVEVNAGRIIVDSNPLSLEICIADNTNKCVENIYKYSDFNTERFIYVPKGKSYLTFSHDGLSDLYVVVEVREHYDTV